MSAHDTCTWNPVRLSDPRLPKTSRVPLTHNERVIHNSCGLCISVFVFYIPAFHINYLLFVHIGRVFTDCVLFWMCTHRAAHFLFFVFDRKVDSSVLCKVLYLNPNISQKNHSFPQIYQLYVNTGL